MNGAAAMMSAVPEVPAIEVHSEGVGGCVLVEGGKSITFEGVGVEGCRAMQVSAVCGGVIVGVRGAECEEWSGRRDRSELRGIIGGDEGGGSS